MKAQLTSAGTISQPKARVGIISFSREYVILLTSFLGIYLVLAFRLRYLDIFFGDAVSRTASAFWVLFSRDPHLGAIGFVWLPLPSLLQLPLVGILHLLHADVILAGNLMSAAGGAATLVILNVAMRRANLHATLRWLLLALYGLNPMIMLYSANGMSEAPFIFFVVLAVVSFMWWSDTHSIYAFTLMAAATALALWVRYEAVTLTAAIAFSLVPILVPLARSLGIHVVAERVEAFLTAYLAVSLYSFGLWVFFNWLIMGNPLYFLTSVYGPAAQSVQFRSGEVTYLSNAVGSIPGSLTYGFQRLLWLFPAFGLIATLALIVSLRRRHVVLFSVLLISLSIPLFEIAMIYRGGSFGWLRFFMYGIPFSYLLLIELRDAAPEWFHGQFKVLVWSIVLVALLVSNVASWFVMGDPKMGREEWIITQKFVDPSQPSLGYSLADARMIASYIAQLPTDEKVLVGTFIGFAIPLLAQDPTRYVVTSDRDFESILWRPYGSVTYVLVPKPEGLGASEPVNRVYPTLWESGSTWTELVKSFEDTRNQWKLYRVIGNPVGTPIEGTR